jgi:hypothetical protein
MYSYEIKEMVNTFTEFHGIKDGIALLKDLNRQFKSKDLNDAIYDFCVENYFCQDCLEFAEPHTEEESRPYGDTDAYEELTSMKCPECGEEI